MLGRLRAPQTVYIRLKCQDCVDRPSETLHLKQDGPRGVVVVRYTSPGGCFSAIRPFPLQRAAGAPARLASWLNRRAALRAQPIGRRLMSIKDVPKRSTTSNWSWFKRRRIPAMLALR